MSKRPRFPIPRYPRGWFQLAYADELQPGDVVPMPATRSFLRRARLPQAYALGNDDPATFPFGTEHDDNSYHVVGGSNTIATAVLDGCTVTAGNDDAYAGGGALVIHGSPRFIDCTFARNWAYWGGGVYLEGCPSVEFTRCTFSENQSDIGGGLHIMGSDTVLTDCLFIENEAPT